MLAPAPGTVKAHRGLGAALQEEGRLDEARAQYEPALAADPTSTAARLDLGDLHAELGDLAAAEAAYRDALRVQPNAALPHGRLATLLRGRLPEADGAALEQRLTDPKLADETRADLLFGLAQVLDARGDYTHAADCLRRANALGAAVAQARGRGYDPGEHELLVDGVLAVFRRDFFARVTGAGLATRRPVFVFGLPRSGTTLVEQILASHPAVHGGGELPLAHETFDAIPRVLGRPGPPLACAHDLDAAAVRQLAAAHLGRLDRLDGGRAARVVDKMPHNYIYLGFLAALFPGAAFVHCRRDLRDVAVSWWITEFRRIYWANEPAHIASRIGQYCRLMHHWSAVLPVPVHELRYEALVADLEGESRRLLTACGLDWHPACLEFHRTRRAVHTASAVQVRQPIYTKSVGRWRHYERELAELFALLPVEPDSAVE